MNLHFGPIFHWSFHLPPRCAFLYSNLLVRISTASVLISALISLVSMVRAPSERLLVDDNYQTETAEGSQGGLSTRTYVNPVSYVIASFFVAANIVS